MNLFDCTILITGSSDRVGRTIALHLAEKGAKIAVHFHTQEKKARETVQKILDRGGEAFAVQGDISNKNDWEKMLNTVVKRWGTLRVLINNAAIFYRTPLFDITEQDWGHFLNVNLNGTFWGCQIVGKHMWENKNGKIINIADVSAESPWPNYLPYCVSKAGVVALTKGLAKALAPHVLVNAIAPGTVLLAEKYDEKEEKQLIDRTPLKRVGSPEDIAHTAAFLIEGSDFITGTIIKVDGGRSLS